MDAWPDVTGEDVAAGKVAFFTPAPPSGKRRRASTEGESMSRPWWADERDPKSRLDATATEKRIFCKVYQKHNEWLGRWATDDDTIPIRGNEDWFMENQSSPIRNIAAQLCGISHKTLGKYWGEMQAIGGALTSARPRGPGKKNVEDLAIRGFKPGWGSLYDVVRRRMADVRARGMVNSPENLLYWDTEGPDGPRLPCATPRFFRKILARLGISYARRRKLVVAARRKPYVLR